MTREITIETTETILSRDGSSMTALSCQRCGAGSRLIPFAEAVYFFGMDAITLHRWLNEGRIHFQLSEELGLAICWNTLSALLEKHPEISHGPLPDSAEKPVPPGRRIHRTTPKEAGTHGPRRSS